MSLNSKSESTTPAPFWQQPYRCPSLGSTKRLEAEAMAEAVGDPRYLETLAWARSKPMEAGVPLATGHIITEMHLHLWQKLNRRMR